MEEKTKFLGLVERSEYILLHCSGKRVLHVGCTNFPNTEVKLRDGNLLHQKIEKVASLLHGIDIDKEGIDYLKKKGFDNIYYLDAENLAKPNKNLFNAYDVVALADIIEHSSDPKAILEGAKARLGKDGETIVSFPNAFYWFGFLCALIGKEVTHPEHVAYYSPRNIQELLKRAGFELVEIGGCYEGPLTKKPRNFFIRIGKSIERKLILQLFPRISGGIICRAKKE